MEHHFNVELAKAIGVDEAIFIHNIYFWIKKNEANKKHFYDKNYWTYNSMKAFTDLFPYWSQRQIERIIKNCVDSGYLLKANYNSSAYDRTSWYAITELVEPFYANGGLHFTKHVNGFTQTVPPIPYSNTYSKQDNILITQVEPEGFDSLHFVIAKMFHSLFMKLRGENDTLKKVKTESYVETIRLMLNVDKRSVAQLAALKLYLEDSKKEGSKLNPFWADTIFSLKAFREKSKSGVHRWDLICLELKKWESIEGNYQRAAKLAETINQKAKEYD